MKEQNWHKNFRWATHWSVSHISGLVFEYDEALGWETSPESLEFYQDNNVIRGNLYDQQQHLIQLCRQAAEWASDSRNQQSRPNE